MVSTLLEILDYDTPQHVESLKALMFQPFLRF